MWGSSGDNTSSSGGSSSNVNQAGNGRNSSSSSRKAVYRLLGFVSFCLLLYKAWGPLLLVSCSLAVILHLCYSLLYSDSLFTPYSLELLGHARSLALELLQTLQALCRDGLDRSRLLLDYCRRQYEERFGRQLEAVAAAATEDGVASEQTKRNHLYRPSVLVNKNLADNLTTRNSELYHTFALNGISSMGKTSTPIAKGSNFNKKIEKQNGSVNMYNQPVNNTLSKKISPVRSENKPTTLNLSHSDDILYNPMVSSWLSASWNDSASSEVQDKSKSIRTVQTVAGPLLNSSRYNIDPKVYTDISSPGLSSRLTKYAVEANSRLTHQPQYGTGQFPRVNLNASPIPVLSPKVMKSRMPVTVRVAPPELTNYQPIDGSPAQQQQQQEKALSSAADQNNRESNIWSRKKMTLKRHASHEDWEQMLDLAKKQKADKSYEGQLGNLEEMMQKRARDESTALDDDEQSPQSASQRPTKRSKSSSCHDVLNSLSSSINVLTGVKRKAMDSSRCSSPENEKIFKPSNASTSPNRSSSLSMLPTREIARSRNQLNVRVSIANASGEPRVNAIRQKTPEISRPDSRTPERQQQQQSSQSSSGELNKSTPRIVKEIVISPKTDKLADKLFMKPEPRTNEKLKSLIQDQGKVETHFKTDDKDEIKKQDIDNMRQNSMRMRLKSMFDAISGKSASKIDPDVVIQAEEVNAPTVSSATPLATLNSLTTTTTVNTSPITTTIVPILKSDAENNKLPAAPPKHVTFSLPGSFSSTSSSSSGSNLSAITSQAQASKPAEPKSTLAPSTSAPSFSFGSKPATTTSTSTAVTSSSSNPTSSSGFSFSAGSNTATSAATSSTNATMFAPKSTSTTSAATTTTSAGFSFGAAAKPTTSQPNFSYTPSATMPSFSKTSPTSSAPSFSFSSNSSSSTAPTYSFNSNNYQTSIKSPESTSSTATISSTTSIVSFGNALSKSPSSTSFAPATTSSSTSSIFGAATSNSPFSANNSAAASAAASTTAVSSAPSVFGFNASAGSKPAGTSGFSFNAPTASSASPASTNPAVPASSSTFSFRTDAKNSNSTFAAPVASNAAPSAAPPAYSPFNAPQTSTPSLFSGASTMFKGPATTSATATSAPSIFGSSSSGFGTTPGSAVASTTTTTNTNTSLFGNTAAPASTIPSLFGNTATTTASTAPTPFGAPATQPQQSSIFAGTNATTSPSIFGNSAPTGSLFSGASANAANPASATESANIFGQSKPPPYSATSSTFGATGQSSGFPSPSLNNPSTGTPTFQLGSSSSSNNTPTFGKPAAPAAAAAFGAPASNASSGSIFGSTAAPATNAFGSAPTTNAFGSGTTTLGGATFGTGASATGNSFGSGSSGGNSFASTFGNPAAPSLSFGGTAPTSTQAPSLFGNNAPATSSTSGGTFSFGAQSAQQQQQQPPQQQQQQPSATFGGFNTPSTGGTGSSGTGGVFQFGGATAAKPAGFNFSAPGGAPAINFSGSTQPPAFNAPAPNMFSIGSGSTTPRSRTGRQRRQQR